MLCHIDSTNHQLRSRGRKFYLRWKIPSRPQSRARKLPGGIILNTVSPIVGYWAGESISWRQNKDRMPFSLYGPGIFVIIEYSFIVHTRWSPPSSDYMKAKWYDAETLWHFFGPWNVFSTMRKLPSSCKREWLLSLLHDQSRLVRAPWNYLADLGRSGKAVLAKDLLYVSTYESILVCVEDDFTMQSDSMICIYIYIWIC